MMNRYEQQFASDNYAGVCPEAWAAMDACNRGSAPAYGNDLWTELPRIRWRWRHFASPTTA